jgi:hypothetical protein
MLALSELADPERPAAGEFELVARDEDPEVGFPLGLTAPTRWLSPLFVTRSVAHAATANAIIRAVPAITAVRHDARCFMADVGRSVFSVDSPTPICSGSVTSYPRT